MSISGGCRRWPGKASAADRPAHQSRRGAEHCRFGDCVHNREPGCAVREAIDNGELNQRRLDSYRKLARENARMAARSDTRLRAERERVWRDINKQQRRYYQARHSRR
jgi:ribosome biogenesis GTPase / thiamine phosphate phosphatase